VLSVDVPLGSLARSYFNHIDDSCSGFFGAGHKDRGEFLQGITDCAIIRWQYKSEECFTQRFQWIDLFNFWQHDPRFLEVNKFWFPCAYIIYVVIIWSALGNNTDGWLRKRIMCMCPHRYKRWYCHVNV
jgi:hypothetical protein